MSDSKNDLVLNLSLLDRSIKGLGDKLEKIRRRL